MDRSNATIFSTRFTAIVIALGLLIGAAALWGANKQILGLFHDDGIYAVVGKALAQGEGWSDALTERIQPGHKKTNA